MPDSVGELVAQFSLSPHIEGGFYREVFRSTTVVTHPAMLLERPASTAILFLLTPTSFSAFHRLCSDEVWHFYAGDPVELHLLHSDGRRVNCFVDTANPVCVVPAGTWQAARCTGNSHSLCGCTVAPGFEFEDFELANRAELVSAFLSERELIEAFTRA
jgi:predicted cupin superfamily sugar epimerase